jgi:hypothetical protein
MRIVILTLAISFIAAPLRAQLTHFTTIDGTNSGGASIPVPPIVRFSMGISKSTTAYGRSFRISRQHKTVKRWWQLATLLARLLGSKLTG